MWYFLSMTWGRRYLKKKTVIGKKNMDISPLNDLKLTCNHLISVIQKTSQSELRCWMTSGSPFLGLHARPRHDPHQSTDEPRCAPVHPHKKITWEGNRQTDRHTDFATTRPTRPRKLAKVKFGVGWRQGPHFPWEVCRSFKHTYRVGSEVQL